MIRLPVFLKRFGADVFCLALIALLSAWLVCAYRRDFDRPLAASLSATLDLQQMALLRHNSALFHNIESKTSGMPTVNNQNRQSSAKQALDLVARYQAFLDTLQIQVPLPDRPANTKAELADRMLDTTRQFRNSLLLLTEHSDSIRNILPGCLPECEGVFDAQFRRLLRTGSSEQAILQLTLAGFRAEESAAVLLNYFNEKMEDEKIRRHFMIPMRSADKGIVKTGELYEAEFFVAAGVASDQVQVFVDDQPLLTKDGLAHFTKRYDNPGIRTYHVRIDCNYPLTRRVDSYGKDFQLEVK